MATAGVGRYREAPSALHTFTVEQYMALDIPERTELLEGLIYDVFPRNEPHRYAVRKLGKILSRALDAGYIVQIQDTLAVPDWKGKTRPTPILPFFGIGRSVWFRQPLMPSRLSRCRIRPRGRRGLGSLRAAADCRE